MTRLASRTISLNFSSQLLDMWKEYDFHPNEGFVTVSFSPSGQKFVASLTHDLHLYSLSGSTISRSATFPIYSAHDITWCSDERYFIANGGGASVFKILPNNKLEDIYKTEVALNLAWFLKVDICSFFLNKMGETTYPKDLEPGGYLTTYQLGSSSIQPQRLESYPPWLSAGNLLSAAFENLFVHARKAELKVWRADCSDCNVPIFATYMVDLDITNIRFSTSGKWLAIIDVSGIVDICKINNDGHNRIECVFRFDSPLTTVSGIGLAALYTADRHLIVVTSNTVKHNAEDMIRHENNIAVYEITSKVRELGRIKGTAATLSTNGTRLVVLDAPSCGPGSSAGLSIYAIAGEKKCLFEARVKRDPIYLKVSATDKWVLAWRADTSFVKCWREISS